MTYTQDEINLITLCSFEELTYQQRRVLLSDLKSSFPDFVKYRENLIKSLGTGVYNKVKSRFDDAIYRQKILKKLEEREIICVTYFSEYYPEALKNSPCPPHVLFCKGNIKLLKTRCLAIVGSRRTQPAVLKECRKISSFAAEKFTVVSGMADGGDAAALEGALESGNVISVLAYGFDHVYPAINENLLKKVIEKGLAVTEYTPQIEPKPYNFPVRNRIIAGLSEGVFVVSAGKKSGALITAGYAEEMGRNVFAYPYSPGVTYGEGCNALIKKGAKLTENILDIFEEFGLDFKIEKEEAFTPEETELLNLIGEAGEAFVPDLAEKAGKLPFQLIPLLTSLEIKGAIVRIGGNRYSKIN